MYSHRLHHLITTLLSDRIDIAGKDNVFYARLLSSLSDIETLFLELYGSHPQKQQFFEEVLQTLIRTYLNRPDHFNQTDLEKSSSGHWFLSNTLAGMSLYVDRFCGGLGRLPERLDYFDALGINLLHLMPLWESPEHAGDGGYAVSNFRRVDARQGTLEQLHILRQKMNERGLYLMLDIVLNHTSDQHEWALKAKKGDPKYQQYFYFYDDRSMPDVFDQAMPDIFPQSAPGNFTFVPECNKWVMTVFHHYQWDLNFTNPVVFIEMLDNVLFYANLGVDILRIDAPAFIWKQPGTTGQNLPMAHTLLRLFKQCVQVATPGMALLGEAIVAPKEIMKYFGTGQYTARECDFAYNATQMALQWDALATGDTTVMMVAQPELLKKPFGASWITYTRSHDDIGLGYDDYMIQLAGYDPVAHRNFLKNYFSGTYYGSLAAGALFSFNPKTGDARISGTLASLCGLEKAQEANNGRQIETAIQKILLMQANSFFIGGVPMLFYGDELASINDYSYQQDPSKNYDNRWMHRTIMHEQKIARKDQPGTVENLVFEGTRKLLSLRKKFNVFADQNNLVWIDPSNRHVAFFLRTDMHCKFACLFNFSAMETGLHRSLLQRALGVNAPDALLHDHWTGQDIGLSDDWLQLQPYAFHILEVSTPDDPGKRS